MVGSFEVNIDGDRIAGRKRFFQCLVKQVIHMCYRGWMRFLRFFWDEHDVGAFFAFVSLVYWVFAPATKGLASARRKARDGSKCDCHIVVEFTDGLHEGRRLFRDEAVHRGYIIYIMPSLRSLNARVLNVSGMEHL